MPRPSSKAIASGFDALLATASSIQKVTSLMPHPGSEVSPLVGSWVNDFAAFAEIVKSVAQLPDRERLAQLLFAADGKHEAWEWATPKLRNHYRRMADAVLALINQGDTDG